MKPLGATLSPRPDEPDVRLSVNLHGVRMEFVACSSAAVVFLREWRVRHHPDTVAVLPADTNVRPRLPNERLYLDR